MKIPENGSVTAVMAHPDDIKSVTGVLMRAMSRGCKASLILMTKGEGLKRDAVSDATPHQVGTLRIIELKQFLSKLGIPKERFFIIGVPDGAHTLTALRQDFYTAEGAPFRDGMFGREQVHYKDVFRPGMEYFGENLHDCLVKILEKLKPDLILTHFCRDDHQDHRATCFFVTKAVKTLKKEKKLKRSLDIYAPLVYCNAISWPPKGDHFLTDEVRGRFSHLEYHQFEMTDEEWDTKKRYCSIFENILGEQYIKNNMKKDEVLWKMM